MNSRISCGLLVLVSLCGCATEQLSNAGSRVVLRPDVPTDCQNLGMVTGQGGGTFGGAWLANDQLTRYAVNDAQNKAAALGATHLQLSPAQFGSGHGTTTTATVSGFAYRCEDGAQPIAQAAPLPSCHLEESAAWKSASPSEKKQLLADCRKGSSAQTPAPN